MLPPLLLLPFALDSKSKQETTAENLFRPSFFPAARSHPPDRLSESALGAKPYGLSDMEGSTNWSRGWHPLICIRSFYGAGVCALEFIYCMHPRRVGTHARSHLSQPRQTEKVHDSICFQRSAGKKTKQFSASNPLFLRPHGPNTEYYIEKVPPLTASRRRYQNFKTQKNNLPHHTLKALSFWSYLRSWLEFQMNFYFCSCSDAQFYSPRRAAVCIWGR